MTKEEIIDTLTEILNEAKEFTDCIEHGYSFRTINDFINFPQYIVDNLTNVINDIENDNEEDVEIEHVQEEQKETIDKIVSTQLIELCETGFIDYGFQNLDKDFAKKLHIPDEYVNKCFASYAQDCVIKHVSNDGTEKYENSTFYFFCLDRINEGSTEDCWCSVNDEDIVFENAYCRIYDMLKNKKKKLK